MRSILQNQKIVKRISPLLARVTQPRPHRSSASSRFWWLRGTRLLLPVAGIVVLLGVGVALIGWTGAGPSVSAGTDAVRTVNSVGRQGEPVGSGVPARDRSVDLEYTVQEGETLSEIAYLYSLDIARLALYNNLSNPSKIKPGQRLVIPSLTNAQTIKVPTLPKAARLAVVNDVEPGEQVNIAVDKQIDGRSVTAHFTVRPPPATQFVRYEWDLGDGHKSFRDGTFWTYEKPGTYTVSLRSWDADGRVHLSNKIYIDVPHPGTWASGDQRFITLDDVGEPFDVDGEIVEVLGYHSVDASPIVRAGADQGVHTYAANRAGYYNLTISRGGETSKVYLFVSPIPSRHADRADIDWYRTQFNTGTQSNCGPTMVAMAIAWGVGEYVPVASVRQAVGWQGDGGVSFEDMIRVIRTHGVHAEMQQISGPNDIRRLIDDGKIAILLYNTRSVKRAAGDPLTNLFGAYYQDNVGHYVMVKGYSLDNKWLVVYDPIPSDWSANSARYADGISMIGKNRYYPAAELFTTIRINQVLVVSR